MKMIPFDRDKVRPGYRMHNNNLAILQEFINSGQECVKLEDHGHKTAKTCQTCLCSSRRRFGLNNVGIAIRSGEVFLYRKDL